MNILFLCRLFYPHIGGVEKHVLEISKILIKKGHKVAVITEELSTKDIPVHEIINSVEVYRIRVGEDKWFKKFRIWKELWKLRKLIKASDIIHCHDVFFWYLPFRFMHFKKPAYVTFHGYEDYPVPKKAIIIRRISERLSKGNICVGDFIEKWYGTKPTYTAYGGVGISNFQFPISNKINKESAVFIGRLDEQTGIKLYADAISLIKKKIPNFKFAIIGDGKFRKEIEKDFEVLGFRKDSEKYFSRYRFAFVSRYLSILEAMAAKCLVFAVYDNPLKEDYLRITPFAEFINISKSAKELSDSILYFLNNPEKEKIMVNKGFKWVKNQSWNKLTKLYMDLWNRNIRI